MNVHLVLAQNVLKPGTKIIAVRARYARRLSLLLEGTWVTDYL